MEEESASLGVGESPDTASLHATYQQSKEADKAQLLAGEADPHVSQVAPWLATTGIANILAGCNKESVRRLLADPPSNDPAGLDKVDGHVSHLLELARQQSRTGSRGSRLSRVAARHVNTFEPTRPAIKPFKPVQNHSTLVRYGHEWSRLIIYLVRMQSPEWQGSSPHPSYVVGDRLHAAITRVASDLQAEDSIHDQDGDKTSSSRTGDDDSSDDDSDYTDNAPRHYTDNTPSDYTANAPSDYTANAPSEYTANAPCDYTDNAPSDDTNNIADTHTPFNSSGL